MRRRTTLPDIFDEAFDGARRPRAAPYGAAAATALAGLRPRAAPPRRSASSSIAEGCTFGEGDDAEAFRVDLVPRVLTADEWEPLAGGPRAARPRARRVPRRRLRRAADRRRGRHARARHRAAPSTSSRTSSGSPPPRVRVALAGLDVIRTPRRASSRSSRTTCARRRAWPTRSPRGGRSAACYAGTADPRARRGARARAARARAARRGARGRSSPRIALLTDGPKNTAYWEHARLAELLEHPARRRSDSFHPTAFDVVYRRTDEDRAARRATAG